METSLSNDRRAEWRVMILAQNQRKHHAKAIISERSLDIFEKHLDGIGT